MRLLFVFVVIGLALSASVTPAQKQKPDPSDLFKNPPGDKTKPDGTGKKKKTDGVSRTTPIYGKTIDEWIKQMYSTDPSKSQIAIQNVLMFGTDLGQLAVPHLNKMLKKRLELDKSVRINVVMVLGTLLAEANEPDAKEVDQAVATFKTMLKYESEIVIRYKTMEALAAVGPRAVSAVDKLIVCLHDKSSWEVREGAAIALGRIAYDKKKGPPYPVLHALFGSLAKDPAVQVRLAAMQALTFLGPPPVPDHQLAVYKALKKVGLEDAEPAVRIWAMMSLMSIMGKPDKSNIAKIASYLKDEDVLVRIQAAQALSVLGLDAKEQVGALVTALDDNEKMVQGWAVTALSRMEKYAEPAEKRLAAIAEDKEWPASYKELAQRTVDIIRGKVAIEPVSKDQKDKEKIGPKLP